MKPADVSALHVARQMKAAPQARMGARKLVGLVHRGKGPELWRRLGSSGASRTATQRWQCVRRGACVPNNLHMLLCIPFTVQSEAPETWMFW